MSVWVLIFCVGEEGFSVERVVGGASDGSGAQQVHAAAKVVTEVHHPDLIFVANSPDTAIIYTPQ